MASRRLQLVALVAAAACGLLALALVGGWLGADVDRGGDFCEAVRQGLIAQPANTWSNLGFVVAGLLIAASPTPTTGTLATWPGLVTAYAVIVVLLGPGSAAMHATQSVTGGHLDTSSMYLLASAVCGYALTRLRGAGPAFLVVTFAALLLAAEVLDSLPGDVPVVMTWGNLGFAVLLVAGVGGELALRRQGRLVADLRWGAAAVSTLLGGFVVWNLAHDDGPLCHPHSLFQGHAFWHLACAVAAYLLYRYYASEQSVAAISAAGQRRDRVG